MQEKLHFKGVWFLPGQLDKEIMGTLDYSPSTGIELQLMGLLEDLNESSHDPELILGITADGKKITLYRCGRTNRQFSPSGFEMSRYHVIFMLIGTHFFAIEELEFSRINCIFSDFDQWLNIYGFNRLEFQKQKKEAFLEYKQPGDILFKVSEHIHCKFQFSTYLPLSRHISKVTVGQECEVSLFPVNGTSNFRILLALFESFYKLMALAYFGKPMINKLVLGKETQDKQEGKYIYPVVVYFKTDTRIENYEKKEHNIEFLFTYIDVSKSFETILQKWYGAEVILGPAISGLTEAFMRRDQATEFRFLNLAHAIETLHRRTRKNEVESRVEFKQKMINILSSVRPEYNEWLKNKLEFSNELSLQERLDELVNDVPEIVRKLLFKPSIDEFIKKIKHARNYYTHYSKSLEKKAMKGGELFTLTERLKIFLICLVLKEIGFADDEIVKIILGKGVYLFNHIIKYDEAKLYFSDWQ